LLQKKNGIAMTIYTGCLFFRGMLVLHELIVTSIEIS